MKLTKNAFPLAAGLLLLTAFPVFFSNEASTKSTSEKPLKSIVTHEAPVEVTDLSLKHEDDGYLVELVLNNENMFQKRGIASIHLMNQQDAKPVFISSEAFRTKAQSSNIITFKLPEDLATGSFIATSVLQEKGKLPEAKEMIGFSI